MIDSPYARIEAGGEPKVLVSACLLGERVRYDGGDARAESRILDRWRRLGRLIPFCPEVAGGFPVPRPPAEIEGGSAWEVLEKRARVVDDQGRDVTRFFVEGADKALKAARAHNVGLAVLKDGSPSCGVTFVYDGTFAARRRTGRGVTACLLERHGIRVFSEEQIPEAEEYLRGLEDSS